MKVAKQNEIRASVIENLLNHMTVCGEDVGMIASNSFNFPIVTDEGEEGWVEIVVKIPKEDEGYEKREEYKLKCQKKVEDAKAKAEAKAKKIERDKKAREAKKAKEG